VTLQPRPLNFGDLHTHLTEQRADVIFACFGMNESFAGPEGLPRFRSDLLDFLNGLLDRRYNGATPPRVVLVSPIAHENVQRVPLDPAAHNRDLALYTRVMQEVAAELGVRFIDLFTPTLELLDDPALGDLTINGIHLNEHGYRLAGRLMADALGLLDPRLPGAEGDRVAQREGVASARAPGLERLQQAIREKNELFFYRWRPVNGEYVYGRRKEPFGVVDFPPEMQQLEEMIRAKEREIWTLAKAGSARISRNGRDISIR
jgi:hypothetical protein